MYFFIFTHKKEITIQNIVKEWEFSLDPCKNLIAYLLKKYENVFKNGKIIILTTNTKKQYKKTKTLSETYSMQVKKKSEDCEKAKNFLSGDIDQDIKDELEKTRKELLEIKRVLKISEKNNKIANFEWNLQKEKYFRKYKRFAKNNIKMEKKSLSGKSWDLVGLMGSIPALNDSYENLDDSDEDLTNNTNFNEILTLKAMKIVFFSYKIENIVFFRKRKKFKRKRKFE